MIDILDARSYEINPTSGRIHRKGHCYGARVPYDVRIAISACKQCLPYGAIIRKD